MATVTPVGPPLPFDWFTIWPPPITPTQLIDARWTDGLQLIGTDMLPSTVQAGEILTLRLVWAATAPITQDYTVFLHLIDEAGQPVAQQDQRPGGDFYPTSAWKVGEAVNDVYPLTIPTDATGPYRLLVGVYHAQTGERLQLTTGEDQSELAVLQVDNK